MPKRKGQVGLLGEKRKKQMLFSFTARDGEEWSDDSSDEDFVLSDDETGSSGKRKKRQGKRRRIARKAESAVNSSKDESLNSMGGCDRWGHGLPTEILKHIFEFVVHHEGSIPFLIRAGRVNTTWHKVAQMELLWTNIDLSYGWVKTSPRTLQWFAENCCQHLKQINLTSWKKLLYQDLQVLVVQCPQLESITLSGCIKLKSDTVKLLADSCPKLHTIDLSSCNTDAVSFKSLKYFLDKTGHQLRSLTLAQNKMSSAQKIMSAIASLCPQLRLLDLSQCKDPSGAPLSLGFPVESLHHQWPELRVLRMAGLHLNTLDCEDSVSKSSNGFPKLQELSLAYAQLTGGCWQEPCNGVISRLLKTSTELTLLDLRSNSSINAHHILGLGCLNVAELYLSGSQSAHREEGNELELVAAVMKKWHHSLRILDLSWAFPNVDEIGWNESFQVLEEKPAPLLHTLILNGTHISVTVLKYVLSGCPALQKLSTESCRTLPRGFKDTYTGKESLKKLSQRLHTV